MFLFFVTFRYRLSHLVKMLNFFAQSCLSGVLVSPQSSWEQLTHLDVASIPQTWPEPSPANGYESDVSLFNTFKLLASPALRCSVLDVWDRPELCNNPIQLRLLSAIASARYKGCYFSQC